MPPRLLLAPAGHGKTENIIRRIRQVLAGEPLAPVLVVLPNSIQAGGFRQRLAAAGGALGVEIHTFHTLYAEILSRVGQPFPLMTDPVRLRLLRVLVDALSSAGRTGGGFRYAQNAAQPPPYQDQGKGLLRHYAALRDKPGFIAALRNTIEELKRARILPEDFSRAVRDLEPRLQEIALVYREYQTWLQKAGWADHEGRGWLAAIALEQNPHLGAEIRLLAVSGFDEFNPTQLGVLSLLANRAHETLITLTGDLNRPDRPAHHRFHRAQRALTASLSLRPEMMDSASLLAPAIAQTEANLFQPVIASRSVANQSPVMPENLTNGISPLNRGLLQAEERRPCNDLEFVEAQTRSVEARAALRWIKARIVRDGLALSEVAIFARDLEPYRPFLEETAEEFGIPLRVVGGLPLAENPAIAALLTLLSLPVDDWPRRGVMEAWTSPYFSFPGREAASLLDEISRAAKVVKGLKQWREAFSVAKNRQKVDDPEMEEQVHRLVPLQSLETLESGFNEFVDLLTPSEPASAREFVAFVEKIIGDDPGLDTAGGRLPFDLLRTALDRPTDSLNVVACARANVSTAGRDVAALQAFKDVLRGLVLAEAVVGAEIVTYADFLSDLRGAVGAASFSQPAQSGVMVASALDGRGLSFQAAVLMGLSEGEFPRQEREDILLRERDRKQLRERGLPLETRLHGDEGTLFYQAVTRARQRLLLTRPYLADDGQPWEASPFWEEMMSLNGSPAPARVRPEDGLDPAEAASHVEWREAAREFDLHLKNGVETLKARLSPKAEGLFEGEIFSLAERFGAGFGWSASKLESYGTCPFEFFVAYGLGLEPREEPEEGYDVRALGTMLHEILEKHYAGADLRETAREVFAEAPAKHGFRPTPLWELQQAELLRRLEETVAALAEVSQGWLPFKQELKFGMGSPSLVLETEAGPVRLHGYIDRLDVSAEGGLRVIDYKTGGAVISAAHLREGRRLQLPIYALAAQKALGLGQVASGFYWHIQKAEASSLKLEQFEDGVNSAFAVAIAHVGRHVSGIRAGKFAPKPPAEGCPSYCPAMNFCWRYKKGF